MRRGATTCLSILALLLTIWLGTGNSTIPPVSAGELVVQAASPVHTHGDAPAPIAGDGGGGIPGGLGTAGESGDDDDYWDGVNNDQQPPRSQHGLPLLLQILESWWQAGSWVWI